MAYRRCELGMLVRCKPEEAATKIVRAYREAGGVSTQAASWLGVDLPTLNRWITELDRTHKVKVRIERIRRQVKKAVA